MGALQLVGGGGGRFFSGVFHDRAMLTNHPTLTQSEDPEDVFSGKN